MIIPERPRFPRSRIRKNAGRPLMTLVLANAATMGVFLWPLFFFSLPLKAEEFKLTDGDRVVLIGSTLIEREQESGYWETALTSRFPKANVTFRNLGWSGDTVFCDSRAMFESPAVGLQHLKEDLAELKPTVILLGYGINESFAGEAGLPRFQKGLATLLDMLASTKARIVILSPPPQEDIGWRLPNPAKHNRDLELYVDTLRLEAKKRGHLLIDLFGFLRGEAQMPFPRLFTDNGIHFTNWGYWRSTSMLEQALGIEERPWRIEIDKGPTVLKAEGVELSKVESGPLRFQVTDRMLPDSLWPQQQALKGSERDPKSNRRIRVSGLWPGQYSLQIDGRKVAVESAGAWADGVRLARGPEFDQVEKLRQAIIEKNRLFFHRWRPQNETYIYGFRKHEQGQNAREIPEFDPLIIQLEKKIAELRVPVPHQYELVSKDAEIQKRIEK
jgi:lysophospholipase L1-like esterase